jgi:hypothetical protein
MFVDGTSQVSCLEVSRGDLSVTRLTRAELYGSRDESRVDQGTLQAPAA